MKKITFLKNLFKRETNLYYNSLECCLYIFEYSIFAILLYHYKGIFARLNGNEHLKQLCFVSTRSYTHMYLLYFVK